MNGVGSNAKAVVAAENDNQYLFYAGVYKPHMCQDKLEIRLTNEFLVVDKDTCRQVHTDE